MSESQIRGLLLEEAMLHLLRSAGYLPVFRKGKDETLAQEGKTLFVKGRGERHQIDAIADYRVQPPFSNPQRLLLEAKFYDRQRVGLTVIRNAVGVLNDVSQFFVSLRHDSPSKPRYHYQYAVVSATMFTRPSQRYAYAHDIFLIPLGASPYFRRLLDAIRAAAADLVVSDANQISEEFSEIVRSRMRRALSEGVFADEAYHYDESFDHLIKECLLLGFGLIAVTASGFPIFLVPLKGLALNELRNVLHVRIHITNEGWFLAEEQGRKLFSFDVPDEMINLYAERGELTPDAALNLKQQELYEMSALISEGRSLRIIRFLLDVPWFEGLRRRQQ